MFNNQKASFLFTAISVRIMISSQNFAKFFFANEKKINKAWNYWFVSFNISTKATSVDVKSSCYIDIVYF